MPPRNVKLLDAVTDALIESDRELYNDIEDRDYYEVKAEAAIDAYEAHALQRGKLLHFPPSPNHAD